MHRLIPLFYITVSIYISFLSPNDLNAFVEEKRFSTFFNFNVIHSCFCLLVGCKHYSLQILIKKILLLLDDLISSFLPLFDVN